MRKRPVALLACFALIAGGCEVNPPTRSPSPANGPTPSSPAQATQQPRLAADQVLHVAIPEPGGLDPTRLGAPEILRALQRPLVDFDERGEIVPALAESWDVSDDGKTLTFHLRDARYSNGDPIVAADMVYSARRLIDPRTEASYADVMAAVVGGRELLAMAGAKPQPSNEDIDAALQGLGVEAPDARTFIVHLENPQPEFLSVMTLWFFVPLQKRWITSANATEAGNFVSSGPFILDTWDHLSEIVLKPNPFWWGDIRPTLTDIRMSFYGEHDAQLAYEAGDLDLVITPTEDIRRVRDHPVLGAEYHEDPQLAVDFYSFNNFQDPNAARIANPGPTANREFRIALTQAIDKQALIDLTWAGVGKVANSFIMPGIPGHQPDLNPYPYDLESAERHMATALDELGVDSAADLELLKIGFVSGFDNEPRVAFLVEAWGQAFGLEFEQIGLDLPAFLTARRAATYDIAFDGWSADYPDPGNQLNGNFTCRGGNNDRQYCSPDFDALVARAAAELDPARRVAIYQEAQTLLMNDAPILPLRYHVVAYEVRPYVVGLTDYPPGFRVPGDYYYETVQILDH